MGRSLPMACRQQSVMGWSQFASRICALYGCIYIAMVVLMLDPPNYLGHFCHEESRH